MEIKKTIQFGENTLTIETGVIARQATGSVLVDLDGTTVLVTVVGAQDEKDESRDFFPLRVDYIEKAYSYGKVPGGFFKREGRPGENETLISRLIDRPIRPLFPKKFSSEVQITATTLSMNPNVAPDIVAIIGASAALAISGIPFQEVLAAARVGYIDGQFVLNPSCKLMEKSQLDLVVAGTKNSVLMVESEAKLLSEDTMLEAVMFGHNAFVPIISLINELASEVGKPKWDWVPPSVNTELVSNISNEFKTKVEQAYRITDKLERKSALSEIKKEAVNNYLPKEATTENTTDVEITENRILKIVEEIESEIVRGNILNGGTRIDGRDLSTVRPITVKTDLLKHAHGSALFTRGETQALAVVTLGTNKDAQMIETPNGEMKENFMLHYNFPPYCVNEMGMMGSPKRREIGHGKLAKRGVSAVVPSHDEFPYVIRVVSEITESNGSSSMASVCGSSLALMAAGVPVKEAVAGIAMGLIKEGDKFAVISDILGDEDHLGDMDFKVAGTQSGVSALQMDIKISGITKEIMHKALKQARDARLHILGIMNETISQSRDKVAENAPHIISMKIHTDKIKDVIGKGGATIKSLIEATGSTIDIDDQGNINIAGTSLESAEETVRKIEAITSDVEVGKVYEGKVIKILDFGAFVNILPGKDGLLHISQIVNHRIDKVTDELHEGQFIMVKVLDIDRQGRIKLSKKVLEQ